MAPNQSKATTNITIIKCTPVYDPELALSREEAEADLLLYFFFVPTILAGPGDSVLEVCNSFPVILVPSITLAPSVVRAAIGKLLESPPPPRIFKLKN